MSSLVHSLRHTPPRRLLGFVIVLGGAIGLGAQLFTSLPQAHRLAVALGAGALGALATALGTLPALAAQGIGERSRAMLLAVGSGMMLAAAVVSLGLPALAEARAQGASSAQAIAWVSIAAALGAWAMAQLDRFTPHVHALTGALPRQTLLFVAAITLHNVPEGLALGVAYGSAQGADSKLALAIALQDLPEGLVVALALIGAGLPAARSALAAAATGLAEPLFAAIGACAVALTQQLLPWGLAFAAGAMLFAVGHEMLPRLLQPSQTRLNTCCLGLGSLLFLALAG